MHFSLPQFVAANVREHLSTGLEKKRGVINWMKRFHLTLQAPCRPPVRPVYLQLINMNISNGAGLLFGHVWGDSVLSVNVGVNIIDDVLWRKQKQKWRLMFLLMPNPWKKCVFLVISLSIFGLHCQEWHTCGLTQQGYFQFHLLLSAKTFQICSSIVFFMGNSAAFFALNVPSGTLMEGWVVEFAFFTKYFWSVTANLWAEIGQVSWNIWGHWLYKYLTLKHPPICNLRGWNTWTSYIYCITYYLPFLLISISDRGKCCSFYVKLQEITAEFWFLVAKKCVQRFSEVAFVVLQTP